MKLSDIFRFKMSLYSSSRIFPLKEGVTEFFQSKRYRVISLHLVQKTKEQNTVNSLIEKSARLFLEHLPKCPFIRWTFSIRKFTATGTYRPNVRGSRIVTGSLQNYNTNLFRTFRTMPKEHFKFQLLTCWNYVRKILYLLMAFYYPNVRFNRRPKRRLKR